MKGLMVQMTENSQKIQTNALYVNLDRGVATLNLSEAYYNDIYSLINSDELLDIVKLYLGSRNPDYDDDAFDNDTRRNKQVFQQRKP